MFVIRSLVADHDDFGIVAPYLEDVLKHLPHLRQMSPVILLHFEDASPRVEGEDHEVQGLREARTLTAQFLSCWHNLRLAIVEQDRRGVRVAVFLLRELEKRLAFRGRGESLEPRSVLEILLGSLVQLNKAEVDKVITIIILVQTALHVGVFLSVFNQLVLFVLDH